MKNMLLYVIEIMIYQICATDLNTIKILNVMVEKLDRVMGVDTAHYWDVEA